MRLALPVAIVALAACATPREEKMPFAEAFAALTPPAATDLEADLARFAARARDIRGDVSPGASMPAAARENWSALLSSLDVRLAQSTDAAAEAELARAGAALEVELELEARAWGDFPADLAERIVDRTTALGVRLAEVRRPGVPRDAAAQALGWPVEPVEVTSLFGRRFHPVDRIWRTHVGVDLEAYDGQLVSAAGSGTVARAGWNGPHGQMVELHHPRGVVTRYSHLSVVVVEEGAEVAQGDPIGLAGKTGVATGPHLHFELWRDGRPRDPLEEIPAAGPKRAATASASAPSRGESRSSSSP